MSRRRKVGSAFVTQVGARVRVLRYERGLTMDALAELSGCSVDGIRQIELGRSTMTIESARKLARALDVQPFDLLNYDPNTSDQTWFVETMRLHPNAVRPMLTKLRARRRGRAARR